MSRNGKASRRGWFSSLVPKLPEVAPEPRRWPAIPILRPPGALPEEEFLAACTRCGDCLKACPHGVLQEAYIARLPHLTGTPTFDAETNPCRLCEDLPCIAACKPKALREDLPAKMGEARINPMACIAATGCQACVDVCPVPWAVTVRQGNTPLIDPKSCVGCGMCAQSCRAPIHAIIVTPRALTPTPAATPTTPT